MSIGVILTDEDLQAIKKLYEVRWTADITNWKEKNTENFCLWKVTCPDKNNSTVSEWGSSLADTIDKLLVKVLK